MKIRLLDFCEKRTVSYRVFNVDFENEIYLCLAFSVLEIKIKIKFAIKMSELYKFNVFIIFFTITQEEK